MSALARILESKRDEVAASSRDVPVPELVSKISEQEPPRGFLRALRESSHSVALIAEVKGGSPSQGTIRPNLDTAEVARSYEVAGADCLSVLTDGPFFQGSLASLRAAKGASKLPALRKDFVFDPYQVLEARANGADAILLIVAALERSQLQELMAQAGELGMDVLVEVHSETEADLALELGCDLMGVNNRDLATLQTDLAVSRRLLPRIAPHAFAVSESGISEFAHVEQVRAAGAKAVLIGTAFCAAPDIPSKVKEVMGW